MSLLTAGKACVKLRRTWLVASLTLSIVTTFVADGSILLRVLTLDASCAALVTLDRVSLGSLRIAGETHIKTFGDEDIRLVALFAGFEFLGCCRLRVLVRVVLLYVSCGWHLIG